MEFNLFNADLLLESYNIKFKNLQIINSMTWLYPNINILNIIKSLVQKDYHWMVGDKSIHAPISILLLYFVEYNY